MRLFVIIFLLFHSLATPAHAGNGEYYSAWDHALLNHLRAYVGSFAYEKILHDPDVEKDLRDLMGQDFDSNIFLEKHSGSVNAIGFNNGFLVLEGRKDIDKTIHAILLVDVSDAETYYATYDNRNIVLYSRAHPDRFADQPEEIRTWITVMHNSDKVESKTPPYHDIIYRHYLNHLDK